MNKNFWLKGFQVKAIIISLSLALPLVVMAQTYSDRKATATPEVPVHIPTQSPILLVLCVGIDK